MPTSVASADARGEDTNQMFRDFMQKHGEFFPEDPQSLVVYGGIGTCSSAKVHRKSQNLCDNFCKGMAATY